jgi:acyl-CoA synthetase (AMP-forming)/AMP-acid ligase II
VPAVLPFYHIYGLVIVLLGKLLHGCKIVTLPKFEPKSFLKLLDQHQVLLVRSNISTAYFSQQYKEALNLQQISLACGLRFVRGQLMTHVK